MRKFFPASMLLSHLPINWENVPRDKNILMGLKCEFTWAVTEEFYLTNFPENFSLIKVNQDMRIDCLILMFHYLTKDLWSTWMLKLDMVLPKP